MIFEGGAYYEDLHDAIHLSREIHNQPRNGKQTIICCIRLAAN